VKYWLLKTEPSTYSFDTLEKERRTVWDGVANAVALKHLRSMAAGDQALIYHTGAEKQVVGIAEVIRAAYPDPTRDDPRLVVVDLAPVRRVSPITLATIKADKRFADWELVRLPRLSVMPVSPERFKLIASGL
jgi:predicted RNA-binding protein with PUA-like domain